ncbi:MAG TPA: Hsp20/alpha crystallin family protein [Verrucomicrobiae bacterium]
MNVLARWNQLNELEDLQHSLRSLFSRSSDHWANGHRGLAEWIPLVEISEDARGYVLKAELPQVKKEDVKIAIEDGTLTITGDRKFDQNRKKDQRVEYAYGRFAHSFLIPEDARPARVTAVFKNGVLTVHLARNDKARRRQVNGRDCSAATVRAGNGFAPPVRQVRNTGL